ncbi:uncharacterized protein E5676_scaffold313G001830 [Cucumis melo var. makuwa]|uniref:Uncharacterized protein n=1 Tax=Cucumis melo var. makuwa TaxID=1194695 RepID=A0A5A7V638_CUCMM|nr:uncharacterized protein E6C27_scaffold154G002090 [Cucumis melo var. makuwa]TYK26574.1 uncharacterized protein E5676_scaffold313G001830 [Cucumis melo var. makuwa]
MTEILSLRLYGTVCTQVKIELPMPDTLPTSAESSESNFNTWLELYFESVHVEIFCYFTNQVMSGLHLVFNVSVGSTGIVRGDDVCWLHAVFRDKTAVDPGECVTTWYQSRVMPPRTSRRRRQNQNETQDPTQGQSERGSSTPIGQNEAGSEDLLDLHRRSVGQKEQGLVTRGILARIFLGRTLKVLELSPFPSLQVHFQWFLTPDERSPFVESISHLLDRYGSHHSSPSNELVS